MRVVEPRSERDRIRERGQATWVPAMRRFMEAMITDLDQRAVADIVADLRSARCFGGAPEEVRDWIAFFEAAGLRRDADVIRRGEALARRARDAGEDVPEIVAQEILVAEVRSGAGRVARPADAERGYPDSVALRYLRSRLPPGATGQPTGTSRSAP